MSIVLKNARIIVTQDEKRNIVSNKDILIEEGKISQIGDRLDGDDEIDCSRSLVMPGLINTHTHIAMTRLRGIADDVVLDEFLEKTFAIDSKQNKQDVYRGALLGCLESIKFGTTTFHDLYYFEDMIAKASDELGIRAVLSWAVLDREMTTQKGDPIDNCDKFISDWKKKSPLINPNVGVQGVYVSSEETYHRAAELSKKHGVGIHTHLSETRKEVYDNVKKTGMRPVEWLDEMGILRSGLTAAHCVWLTKPEIAMLAKTGTGVSHNPTSNLKLASGGLCPVPELVCAGACVSLGTDGCSSNNNLDLFKEMKLAALLHKNAKWDAKLIPAQKALDMATIEGAGCLGIDSGSIEAGKHADILIVNLDKAHLTPMHDPISNIVYSMEGGDVDTVIIGGKIVMKDRVVEGEFNILEGLNTPWHQG